MSVVFPVIRVFPVNLGIFFLIRQTSYDYESLRHLRLHGPVFSANFGASGVVFLERSFLVAMTNYLKMFCIKGNHT